MSRDVATEFEQACLGWEAALQADEWFFARLCERLVDPLSPSEAFASIGGVAELIVREADPFLVSEEGILLLSLARHSDTTELHPALEAQWQRVMRGCPGRWGSRLHRGTGGAS